MIPWPTRVIRSKPRPCCFERLECAWCSLAEGRKVPGDGSNRASMVPPSNSSTPDLEKGHYRSRRAPEKFKSCLLAKQRRSKMREKGPSPNILAAWYAQSVQIVDKAGCGVPRKGGHSENSLWILSFLE